MENLVNEFMSQESYAVAGSFRNSEKYAYKVFLSLVKKKRRVYPVNPKIKEVEGVKCYVSIKDLPEKVDVVNLVTPPAVTEEIVKQCLEKGITRIWMQPGAESEKAVSYCGENGIKVVSNTCMILQK